MLFDLSLPGKDIPVHFSPLPLSWRHQKLLAEVSSVGTRAPEWEAKEKLSQFLLYSRVRLVHNWLQMGNWLSKFCLSFRRHCPLPGGCHPVVFPIGCDGITPMPRHQDPVPLPPGLYMQPKRPCPLPRPMRSPLGNLPLVN